MNPDRKFIEIAMRALTIQKLEIQSRLGQYDRNNTFRLEKVISSINDATDSLERVLESLTKAST